MRTRLLALAAVATAALWVGANVAAGGGPALSSYRWQQPGTAPVHNHAAQPVLWTLPTPDYAAGASYVWVEPGTAPPKHKAPSPY